MKRLATIKRYTAALSVVPGARAIGKYLFDATLRRLHREAGPNRSASFRSWTFTDDQRAFVSAAYRESNETFKKQLGAAAKDPAWVDWFATTLGETA